MEACYQEFMRVGRFWAVLIIAIVGAFAAEPLVRHSTGPTLIAYAIVALGILRAVVMRPLAARTIFVGDLDLRKLLIYSVIVGIVAPVFGILIEMALPPNARGFDLSPGFDGHFALISVTAIVLAPLVETLFFQVWLQSSLARWPWLSVAVASIAFIAIHLRIDAPLVASALAFTGVRAFTRSSGAAVIGHTLTNLLAFSAYLFVGK